MTVRAAALLVGPDTLTGRLAGTWLTVVRLVWAALALLIVALYVPGVQALVARSEPVYGGSLALASTLLAAVYLAVAALLLWRGADRRMTLFAAFALLLFGTVSFPKILQELASVSPWLAATVITLDILGLAAFTTFVFVFPDGRFVPGWTRWIALGWFGVQVVDTFERAGLLPAWQSAVLVLTVPAFIVGLGSAAFSQIFRFRRVSNPAERQQTKWTAFGFAVALGGYLALGLVAGSVPSLQEPAPMLGVLIAGDVILALIPLSVAVALLRHGLYDVDALIGRTLVYGTLTASVVVIYVLIVAYLGSIFRTQDNLAISLVATGAAAVLFQPLREQLQRAVKRLLYGQRDEPYAVLSAVTRQMGTSSDSTLALVAHTIGGALKLPYVAIRAAGPGGELTDVAVAGAPLAAVLHLPLPYQGAPVGELVLGQRGPSESFSAADRRLLDDLARQAGAAVHVAEQTAELRRSRERLVSAREEERRRLRRDLHDGLGPTLAALTLKLDTARNLLGSDARADALLEDLSMRLQAAIGDIRRLVYALRPPALDDLGLLGALRQAADAYDTGVRIVISAPALPLLPAAVEVAAYRIAVEALTNVVRHARAASCAISLAVDGPNLRIEVEDDGVGLPEDVRAGIGLASMRERAEELGGTLRLESTVSGGVRVSALLPLPPQAAGG
jgi:signal transduction histidine kinase